MTIKQLSSKEFHAKLNELAYKPPNFEYLYIGNPEKGGMLDVIPSQKGGLQKIHLLSRRWSDFVYWNDELENLGTYFASFLKVHAFDFERVDIPALNSLRKQLQDLGIDSHHYVFLMLKTILYKLNRDVYSFTSDEDHIALFKYIYSPDERNAKSNSEEWKKIVKHPESIKKFLENIPVSTLRLTGKEAIAFATYCPSLTKINLTSCHDIDDNDLNDLVIGCPLLESLSLSNERVAKASRPDITDIGLEYLGRLSHLKHLELRNFPAISDRGLEELAKIKTLQSLLFQEVDNITYKGLSFFKQDNRLKTLKIIHCPQISDPLLNLLEGWHSLKELLLSWCSITDAGLGYLNHLTSLHSLTLGHCSYITIEGMPYLSALPNLKTLNLTECKGVTDEGIEAILAIPNLTSLNLSWCEITNVSLEIIVKEKKLKELNLQGCDALTDYNLLKELHELTSLDLSWSSFDDNGMETVCCIESLTKLIIMHCSRIHDGGMRFIPKLSKLKELNLKGCENITNLTLTYVGKLSELEILDLTDCYEITDIGLWNLSNLKQLKVLKLRGAYKITDEGLRALVNHCPKLEVLDLTDCRKISDQGFEVLVQLKGLEYLDLSWCEITDYGLAFISQITSLKTLKLVSCPHVTTLGISFLAPLTHLSPPDLRT